ncbi:MAG: DNA polymerase III subunit beta [Candidatus Moranbacteria bacterium]|nr:DNA polymerase III subunit beta [Candidatus Moranbacteria bacterium]
MKLICTQENFKKAIYNTERVVGRQITLPILENILLETEKGMLKASATNLEIGVSLKIGAKIEKEGKITVPAKLISGFVSNLPISDTISLEVKNSILKISSGEYDAQIKGLGAQEFPIIPELEGDFLFSLPAQKLRDIISKLLVCVSIDNARPELTGVNVLFFEKEIHLAGTDSFRLAEAILPVKQEKDGKYPVFMSKVNSLIIPAQAFAEVLRIIGNETQEVKIAIGENQIFFQVDSIKVVSRLINGKYPEYKHIIPKEFATRAYLGKEELSRAVKVASIFTHGKSGEVNFKIDSKNKKVVIQAQSEEAGENKSQLRAEVSGPDQEIVFNPRYILDGINSINTYSLALSVNNNSSPALLQMMGDETKKAVKEYAYVVMPIKS